jgi:hypothetical protein
MEPYAYLSSYYYIDKAGIIPARRSGGGLSEAAVGPLRSLHYIQDQAADDDTAWTSLEALFAWKSDEGVDPGGYAIALSQGPHGEVAQLAEKNGYSLVLAIGNISVFQKSFSQDDTRIQLTSELKIPTSSFDREYNYLILYQDESQIDPTIKQDFDQIFSQGYAHVFKRKEH